MSSPAVGSIPPVGDSPTDPTAQSVSGGAVTRKVVKKVIRKVKKTSLTSGIQSQSVDAERDEKKEVEKANSSVGRLAIAASKPSTQNPVAPAEVVITATESLTSGPEQKTERSCEVMEAGLAKGKVKKVIRKVIKKKIVKKLVPKGTLASKKAAEAALATAEKQAESGHSSCDVDTDKAEEKKEKSLVPVVHISHNTEHSKEEIGLAIGENKGSKCEKSSEREGNSRENPNSKFGNKKEEEESKEIVARIEGEKENSADSKKKDINGEIKVGDEIKKEEVECSASNSANKNVRKVIRKKIVKKLVPKGTLLAKRCAEENLNQAAKSEAKNPNPVSKETLILSEKPLTQKPCSTTGTEPEQYKAQKTVVSNKGSSSGENPNSSSNCEAQKNMETEGLKERQKRKLGTIPAKRPADDNVILAKKIEAKNPGTNSENNKPQQDNVITRSDKMPQNSNPCSNLGAEETKGMTEKKKRRKTEIFVGGLDKEVKEVDIKTVFEKAGEIVEVRMFMENNTGKNKGYCFLRYKEPGQAKKAVSMFSKVEVKISTV